ncbi:hypothetical protein D9757_006783 [Collybiopsis confluens]|uniref:Uncharacterized protein n=1 Tax=Collybiopsis confluens TaxID=2823264 RepID=A0A8H5HM89_9AGAR|nr:hypothetical protein D9757_006783 [Collybiopsis confluens]
MLKAKKIECWIATCSRIDPGENTVQLQCGPAKTELDRNGTTVISTSICLPSSGLANDRDYNLYWRTVDSDEPLSLWCTIISKKPAGCNSRIEAKGWMCRSRPDTQSRSTVKWRENKELLRPYSIFNSCKMGSMRLEIQRLNGNVQARCHNGKDDVTMDVLDEDQHRPWLVFEFNFEREPDDTLGCVTFNPNADSPTSSSAPGKKRKRRSESTPSVSDFREQQNPSSSQRPRVFEFRSVNFPKPLPRSPRVFSKYRGTIILPQAYPTRPAMQAKIRPSSPQGVATTVVSGINSSSPASVRPHSPPIFRNATPGPSSSSVAHEPPNKPNSILLGPPAIESQPMATTATASTSTSTSTSTGGSRTSSSHSEDRGSVLADHNESDHGHYESAELSRKPEHFKKLLEKLKSQNKNLDEKVERAKQEMAEIAALKKQIEAKEKEFEQVNRDINKEFASML